MELLNRGKTNIKVKFETSGIFASNDGINYLCFKATELERVFDPVPLHKLTLMKNSIEFKKMMNS